MVNSMEDMTLVLFYANHIENPCGIPGTALNIREFYIREVKERVLPVLTNPYAREFIEEIISKYN
jgi:hypothetical protein